MVFLGGAVLANIVSISMTVKRNANTYLIFQMADKDNMWVSKQEWQEQGPRVLEKLGPR